MRRMSKFVGLFEKYGNVDEDKERHLGRINWAGHIKAQGTFSGSAFMTGYKDSFISTDLKSSSNPRGSILMEAKNYTDSKVATAGKTLYAHYIRLEDGGGRIFLNYISSKAEPYTVQTLKADFTTSLKKLIASGYFHGGIAQYFDVDGEYFVVGILKYGETTINNYQTPTFSTIQDHVEAI